nr:DUF4920 domain-containing protein [Allomuricauda sp.]
MKVFNTFAIVLPMFFVMLGNAQKQESMSFYGEEFKMNKEYAMASEVYGKIASNDTIKTQLTGVIKEVCQAKGCWMKVKLDSNDEVFVKFKDYGFFVPTNSADKNVVLNGVAFLEEVSIEEQRHYAKDRGDSPEEIAKINTPKKTLRFEADGVLIQD